MSTSSYISSAPSSDGPRRWGRLRRGVGVAWLAFASASVAAAAPPVDAFAPLVWSADRPADRPVVPGGKGFIVARDGRVICWATPRVEGRVQLKLFESRDGGRTFAALAGVVDADEARGCDLGDASILETRDGALWVSYRHNHYRGPDAERPRYAIKAARSTDGGATWGTPTLVAESVGQRGGPSRGLWASFLFERADGVVQCYYDDEDAPFPAGKPGHQFITMRTWDGTGWGRPVTASRAHDGDHLSRDGMMSVVELSPMRLLMVFESVATRRPHENVVRRVTSDDGGATWSWQRREREVVYAPPKSEPFMALAPWMTRLTDGRLVVVFCTDEDRDQPFISGTPAHRMRLDVKGIVSADAGQTWSASFPIAEASHHYYLPGVAARRTADGDELIVSYLDFADGTFRLARATVPTSQPARSTAPPRP